MIKTKKLVHENKEETITETKHAGFINPKKTRIFRSFHGQFLLWISMLKLAKNTLRFALPPAP